MKIKETIKNIIKVFHYLILSKKHSAPLSIIKNDLKQIKKNDILLFCTLRNEAHRIDFFLEYYRKLGVNHFIFVDNGSNDDFLDLIANCDDVSVYYTEASYKESNYGMHWLNHLLRKHGTGHWCLTCDPDEFLVYPQIESQNLVDLTSYLDQNHRISFFTIMIDMYGKGLISDAKYKPGTNPLSVSPYFDQHGYFFHEFPHYPSWAQGGVRLRTLFKDNPESAPAINKIPLIKWKWYYAYTSSMHKALPNRLNYSYQCDLTGALLHFKFIASFEEKIVEEIKRNQHFDNSIEYRKYQELLGNTENYNKENSAEYIDWKQLMKLGLIKAKEWL